MLDLDYAYSELENYRNEVDSRFCDFRVFSGIDEDFAEFLDYNFCGAIISGVLMGAGLSDQSEVFILI